MKFGGGRILTPFEVIVPAMTSQDPEESSALIRRTAFDYLKEMGESFWSPSYITPKHFANTKGYYVENILTPTKEFFLSGSYRIDDHSTFKKHDTFNISTSYNIEQTRTKLKSSFGTGFKAPSLYQLP